MVIKKTMNQIINQIITIIFIMSIIIFTSTSAVFADTIYLSPETLSNATVGNYHTQPVSASGLGGFFYISEGDLPEGMLLNHDGMLLGTPTQGGSFSFTIAVLDGINTGSKAYTLTVNAPMIYISSATLSNAKFGIPYSRSLSASGGTAPYTYALTAGTLPSGLSFNSSGTLSGTPTEVGIYAITIRATDSSGGSGPYYRNESFTLMVTLDISPAIVSSAILGEEYYQNVSASGGIGPYTYALTAGTLPPGLSFSSSGTLSGTPTAVGTFHFTVAAMDSSGGTPPMPMPHTGSRAYSLTVINPSIVISPSTVSDATVGTAYSQSLTASGGTAPYTYALTAGTLPSGLSFNSSGTLSGIPTAAGTFHFTVIATDSSTGSGSYNGSRAYTLTVGAPTIAISPTTLSNATVGIAYSQSLTASGGTAPYTYLVTAGTLPSGLSLSSGGTLSGTPTAGGTFNFSVTATDSSTGSGPYNGSRAYTLTVGAPTIDISPTTVSNATVGIAYSQSLAASGGTAPYTYLVTAGTLPSGLSLSSGGTLSGTPTAGGTFNFSVTATDSSSTGPYTSTLAHTLTVSIQSIHHSGGGSTSQKTIPNESDSSNTKITFTIGSKLMFVEGLENNMNVAAFIQPGTNRTMVPVRYLSEQLGAEVEWLSANKQVKIVSGNTVIFLTIGSKKVLVNGVEREIDSPALLNDSYTFVPIRFIAEALGATVDWNASNPEQITITRLPSLDYHH